MKKSFEPIPELVDELNEEEFETEDVSVTITELSTSELAKNHNWIGQNRPKYSDEEDNADEESASEEEEAEEVPGMGLSKPAASKKTGRSKADSATDGGKTDETAADADRPKWQIPATKKPIKSKRELGVIVQKDAMKTLKNSKAFQQKQRLDMLRDRKKARKEKTNRIRTQEKAAQRKGGHVNERKIKRRMKLKRKGKGGGK